MTLGERNNNPLNIRKVAGQHWRGEALPQRGSGEGAFCCFESMAYGIRAAFCLLRTYRNKYKANCICDIITRWAPPSENDTPAYIRNVCKLTGFGGKRKAHGSPVAEARQGNGTHRKPNETLRRTARKSMETVSTFCSGGFAIRPHRI